MREEAVKEFVASAAEADAQNISRKIAENLKRNEAAIKEDAVAAFSALCDKAALLQNDDGLGDIETIRFSFLRTGLAEEKAFYRIDADDERWLTRENPCFVLWDATFAFGPYFELARALRRKARSFGRNLREVDAEPRIRELSEIPRGFVNVFIAKTAREFGELPAYAALSKAKDCAITAGEYRGEQAVVFPKEEKPVK